MGKTYIANTGLKKIFNLIKSKLYTVSNTTFTWNGLTFSIYRCGNVKMLRNISGAYTSNVTKYQDYTLVTGLSIDYRPAKGSVAQNVILAEGVQGRLAIQNDGSITLLLFADMSRGYTPLISVTYI